MRPKCFNIQNIHIIIDVHFIETNQEAHMIQDIVLKFSSSLAIESQFLKNALLGLLIRYAELHVTLS